MTEPLQPYTGWIEVICGGMFSGKTEELIRRLRRAILAGQKVAVFKPWLDSRYRREAIVSHDARQLEAQPVHSAQEILLLGYDAQVIGIDEAQFFDNEIVDVANTLANQGKRVIISGLDMDYKGRPFGPMPYLMAIAEFLTKLHAICKETGKMAHYSYRLIAQEDIIALGGSQEYIPLSRAAFWQKMQNT